MCGMHKGKIPKVRQNYFVVLSHIGPDMFKAAAFHIPFPSFARRGALTLAGCRLRPTLRGIAWLSQFGHGLLNGLWFSLPPARLAQPAGAQCCFCEGVGDG